MSIQNDGWVPLREFFQNTVGQFVTHEKTLSACEHERRTDAVVCLPVMPITMSSFHSALREPGRAPAASVVMT